MHDFDPHRSGSLTASFDASRKIPPAEILEQLRHNYYIDATMRGNNDPVIGGLNVSMSGRMDMDVLNNSDNKKKRDRENFMLALMISNMSIRQMEDRLAKRYGENFAENLTAENLAEDAYKRLMGINNKTERRRQIAFELNKSIQDGNIDTGKIYQNSDFKDWLGTHKENRRLKLETSQNIPDSGKSVESEKKAEDDHNLSDGSEESAFDAIFADKGPIVK